MSSKKLITVYGATGTQGSSVARSLLQNKDFSVRAITRNAKSDAAKALASLGAEVVEAQGSSKDDMKAAFNNSWGAFVNTIHADPMLGPSEYDIGKVIVDAAAEAGVQHLVYSSAADTEALTKGEVICHIMMNKSKILQHAKGLSAFANIISVDAGWYFENFQDEQSIALMGGFPCTPDDEGVLTLRVPKWGNTPERVPFIAVEEDYGDIVHGVFLDPEKYDGKLVQGTSDIRSFRDIADTVAKVTGKKTGIIYLDELPTYGIPAVEHLKDMFEFLHKADGRYFNGEESEIETARALKAGAFAAIGARDDSPALMDAEKFFQKYFAAK